MTAVGAEGGEFAYAISGASEFAIDEASGQIEVAVGATLDYETLSTYSVRVSVSGAESEGEVADAVMVIIHVLDVDEGGPSAAAVVAPIVYDVGAESSGSDAASLLSVLDPGDKRYAQGESIEPFAIDVDGDAAMVKVVGLPTWLSYSGGEVSGSVAPDARLGVYEVAVTATGEAGETAAAHFSITIVEGEAASHRRQGRRAVRRADYLRGGMAARAAGAGRAGAAVRLAEKAVRHEGRGGLTELGFPPPLSAGGDVLSRERLTRERLICGGLTLKWHNAKSGRGPLDIARQGAALRHAERAGEGRHILLAEAILALFR